MAGCVLLIVAVLLQVSLMPFIDIAGGIPDVVVCVVVAIGLLRGPLVGVVAGAAGGFLVELDRARRNPGCARAAVPGRRMGSGAPVRPR